MFKIPLGQLQEKVLRSGKITEAELAARVKNKINELSGLVSEEGATHIIANELGIELVSQQERLKIKELYPGMRNVSVLGKVLRRYDVRFFSKGEKQGKVRSFLIGDETETVRVVLWNEQVDLLEKIQEQDTVLIRNAQVRENMSGKELHLGEQSNLIHNPAGLSVAQVREQQRCERKTIAAAQDGEQVELLGTVVQVFDPRFFPVCSKCSKKVQETTEKNFTCAEHGEVTTEFSYVLNLILDDGTGNIRSIFWKAQSNMLLSKNSEDLLRYKDQLHLFEEVKTELLGEQLKVTGRVKKNTLFDRLEFNVQMVEKANPEEELARLG